MNLVLDEQEARVIACLIEKEITTPDQYPLSLNALVLACNQKTNRDPVVDWTDDTVRAVLERLSRAHLVLERSGFGSRVLKYRHRFCNGDHNPRQCDPQELAVLCELLLRGPQTPGELRARAQRLAAFADLAEIESTLERLQRREDGPYVVALPRAPGAREVRYRHLFDGIPAGEVPEPPLEARRAARAAERGPAEHAAAEHALAERVAALEQAVAELTRRVERLAPAHAPAPER